MVSGQAMKMMVTSGHLMETMVVSQCSIRMGDKDDGRITTQCQDR
jgi:hypothetical protein